MKSKITRNAAVNANIAVHSKLANAGEYQKSPHFRPENVEKVKRLLNVAYKNLDSRDQAKAIDFGCGTGFIIDLIHHRFHEVHGVDITQDMMKHVDLTPGNIFLHESHAEETPFDDDMFDFATAYSFMDHLVDYEVFLQEVFRVLKTGGVFFSDLNPNRDFIKAMEVAEKNHIPIESNLVNKEIRGALHNGQFYSDEFGIDADSLNNAEPIKSIDKGFLAEEVHEVAKKIGFSECDIQYEWFLGQGKMIHESSPALTVEIEKYLNSVAPISSPLFKYLRIILTK